MSYHHINGGEKVRQRIKPSRNEVDSGDWKEAGGEPTLDNLPTEKPALQTGDSVPGQWNIKGKGLKAHENKIINHFTKAY